MAMDDTLRSVQCIRNHDN